MKKDQQILIEKIKDLKSLKPRSEWQTMTRDILLSKISNKELQPVALSWTEYVRFGTRLLRQRFLLEPALVILLVLSFSISSSLVVNAAFYSLPGDPLYRMKIALENTQIAITPGEEKKVDLKIEFAQKRVEEFDKIVAQKDVDSQSKQERLNLVIKEFQKNVVAVKEHVAKNTAVGQSVSDEDKEKTLKIAFAISSRTEELAKSLDKKAGDLNEVDKAAVGGLVAEAVESAQQTSLTAQELISYAQQETQNAATSTENIIEPQDQTAESSESEELPTNDTGEEAATSTINIQSLSGQADSQDVEPVPPVEKSNNVETTPAITPGSSATDVTN